MLRPTVAPLGGPVVHNCRNVSLVRSLRAPFPGGSPSFEAIPVICGGLEFEAKEEEEQSEEFSIGGLPERSGASHVILPGEIHFP